MEPRAVAVVGAPDPPEELRSDEAADCTVHLTAREIEILQLAASGLESVQIASRLRVSRRTVDHHFSQILRRTEARSRTEAIALAYATGVFHAHCWPPQWSGKRRLSRDDLNADHIDHADDAALCRERLRHTVRVIKEAVGTLVAETQVPAEQLLDILTQGRDIDETMAVLTKAIGC